MFQLGELVMKFDQLFQTLLKVSEEDLTKRLYRKG
jgi:hypothetical protein